MLAATTTLNPTTLTLKKVLPRSIFSTGVLGFQFSSLLSATPFLGHRVTLNKLRTSSSPAMPSGGEAGAQ
jgi:hypothetical protein